MRVFGITLFCLSVVLFSFAGWDNSSALGEESDLSELAANNESTDGQLSVVQHKVSINPGIKGGVSAVDLSDDGCFAIIQGHGDSKNVQIWDIEKQQKLHSFDNKTGAVLPVAMSPDGSVAAYGRLSSIPVHEVASGKEKHRWDSEAKVDFLYIGVDSISFSPNGETLLAAHGTRVVGWNVSTGQQIIEWIAEKEELTALSNFFDQGKKIATSGEGERGLIKIWDVETGESIQTLTGGPEEKVTSISVSPDGKKLASAKLLNGVQIWDIASGKIVHTIRDAHSWSDMKIHPHGKWLFYCTREGDIIVLDLITNKSLYKLSRHTSEKRSSVTIWSLAITPSGETLISGGDDGTFKVWDLKTLQ